MDVTSSWSSRRGFTGSTEYITVSLVPTIHDVRRCVPREEQRLLAVSCPTSIPKPSITRQLTRPRSKRILRGALSESTGRWD